jgi:hypothetical protein
MHAQSSCCWTSVSRVPKTARPVTLSNEPATGSAGRSWIRIVTPFRIGRSLARGGDAVHGVAVVPDPHRAKRVKFNRMIEMPG